eukprot:sb/3466909/
MDDLIAVIGPFSSSHVKSCSYTAHRMDLPLVAPTATDPDLTNPFWSDSLLKLSPSNTVSFVLVVYVILVSLIPSASEIEVEQQGGVTLAEEMRTKLKGKGVKVITELELGFDLNPSTKTTKGWINQLKNAVTRVTLLLTHSSVGNEVLKAAKKHDMIGREYVWVASTAMADATDLAFTSDGSLKPEYDGLLGVSAYLDITGGFYKRLRRAYTEVNVTRISPADALVYDGVYLLAHGLDRVIKSRDGDLEIVDNFAGDCYSDSLPKKWTDLVNSLKIKFMSPYTGITGSRSMWPDGNPDADKIRYNIVSFSDNAVTPR